MKPNEVICLGSAIVDVFIEATEEDLASLGLERSSMTLVGRELAMEVASLFPIKHTKSGGSAANTASALATLGVDTGFLGLYDSDDLGESFVREMREGGVEVFTDFVGPGVGTGRCLVFVTKDGERTMATYLGAAATISEVQIAKLPLKDAKTVYIEGYLLEVQAAYDAILKLAPRLVRAGVKFVLSLSDRFLVERLEDSLNDLIRAGAISMVFGNEAEFESLVGTSDMEDAARRLGSQGLQGVITLGSEGALGFDDEHIVKVPANPSVEVVDTTGAGDLFAAGFLFGMVRGFDLETSCRMGVECATEVISHFGARPTRPLVELLAPYL